MNELEVYGPFPFTVMVLLAKEAEPLHDDDVYALKTRVPVRVPYPFEKVPWSVAELPMVMVPLEETVVVIVGEALVTVRVSPEPPQALVKPLL